MSAQRIPQTTDSHTRVTQTFAAEINGHLRVYGSDLERKAAEVRARQAQEHVERERFAAQQKAERATLKLALTMPCPEHHQPPGKPCWKILPEQKGDPNHKAVCGQRIAQALGVARVRRERLAKMARIAVERRSG